MRRINAQQENYVIVPNPKNDQLKRLVRGLSFEGKRVEVSVIEEKPLTIFLNSTEILTAMTVGDYPEFLALGFLANQGMIKSYDEVERIDHDEELQVVVVRTQVETSFEDKLMKKTRTSGCAVGTVFGDLYELVIERKLPPIEVRTSWLYHLAKIINQTPSLYLEAGAVHGTVLCQEDQALVFMEDVGRHNAVDKVAGWMLSNGARGGDKILYTTGRLTSEMVIKTAMMGIPVLVSRSGFTAWGVELARQVDLTLIGRLRGRRFVCLSGESNLVMDSDVRNMPEEHQRYQRKASQQDE